MPAPRISIADRLGQEAYEAFEKHKLKKAYGLWSDGESTSLRQDIRNMSVIVAGLRHDTPERRALLALLGLGNDAVCNRLIDNLSETLLNHSDQIDASAIFDTPWDKRPDSRSEKRTQLGLNTVRLSSVMAEEIDWLWWQRIPNAAVTLINGDPDLGKTWVLLDITARITTGRGFSDYPSSLKGPRDVLWISAEDDDANTIRPRLDALNADASRVHSLQVVRDDGKEQTLNLGTHLGHVDEWLLQHPMVAMVVLDPLAAYLGKIDSHRNSDVRALLTPLSRLAAKHQVAVVGVNHLAKGDGDKAMYRGIGSIAFVAAARSALLVSADPKQKDRRLLTKIKCNLQSEDVGGLAFRIGPHVPGVISWEQEPIRTTADETLRVTVRDDSRAPARAEAKDWLQDVLKEGPVPAADVFDQAKADGIAERTLKYAKKELGVRTEKIGGKGGSWLWSLGPLTPLPSLPPSKPN